MSSENDLALARKIDAACDRFEADWKAGRRPGVAEYCADASGAELDSLRRALEAVERELTERSPSAGDTSISQTAVRTGPSKPTAKEAAIPARIGRFEVKSVLGAGAFGRVYLARDPQLLRDVAIKVPLPGTLVFDGDGEKFLREAQTAATIQHPNICPIHEIGEDGGNPFIVMAYIPGQSLAAQLARRKDPLPEKQAAQIVRKLALALDVAHRKGIIHRDLKPANVMFDKERKDVVIMDFGLARAPRHGSAQATPMGVIFGTPAYMSPEQARGDTKAVGPASDVYSLGVMLYELLTRKCPFAGSVGEVIGQILQVPPDPPSKHRPGLDPRLEAICLSAMEKDPAVRTGTMRALATALLEVLQEPGASPSASAVPPASAAPGGDQGPAVTLHSGIPPRVQTRATSSATADVNSEVLVPVPIEDSAQRILRRVSARLSAFGCSMTLIVSTASVLLLTIGFKFLMPPSVPLLNSGAGTSPDSAKGPGTLSNSGGGTLFEVDSSIYVVLVDSRADKRMRLLAAIGTASAVSGTQLITSGGVVTEVQRARAESWEVSVFCPATKKEFRVVRAEAHSEYEAALGEFNREKGNLELVIEKMDALRFSPNDERSDAPKKTEQPAQEEAGPLVKRAQEAEDAMLRSNERMIHFDAGTLTVDGMLPARVELSNAKPEFGSQEYLIGMPVDPEEPETSRSKIRLLRETGRCSTRGTPIEVPGVPEQDVLRRSNPDKTALWNWAGAAVLDGENRLVAIYSRATPPMRKTEAPDGYSNDVVAVSRWKDLIER